MKINIHLYPSAITHESRMLKITHSLAQNNIFDKIYLVGVLENGLLENEKIDDKREKIRIKRILGNNKYGFLGRVLKTIEWSLRVLLFMRGKRIACINCHSLPVLPISVILKWMNNSKLIYDTHELETETVTMHGIKKKMLKWLEKILIRYVDKVFVVSEHISEWYSQEYKISSPPVVRNIPYQRSVFYEKRSLLRNLFQIEGEGIVFLTSGVLDTGRGIDKLLRVFTEYNRNKHIVFMGHGKFENQIKKLSYQRQNIHFLPAVKPEDILEYITGADVGFCLIENVCLSYYYSLPNKLFEYLMAGLPVCVYDLPEQRRIIEKYSCGWIIPGEEDALLKFINSISMEEISAKKKNVTRIQSEMGWHIEEAKLLGVYKTLFPQSSM